MEAAPAVRKIPLDRLVLSPANARKTPPSAAEDATALILACVFDNSPDFWFNVQPPSDLRKATKTPCQRERIGRAKPWGAAV